MAGSHDGWRYREADEELHAAIAGLYSVVDDTSVPRDVLYGTRDGLRFEVFDFPFVRMQGDGGDATAWLVHLPPDARPGFQAWSETQRRLPFTPGTTLHTRDDRLCKIKVGAVGARRPEDLLRPLDDMVAFVRRYERATTAD